MVNIDRPSSPDVYHNVTTTKHSSTEVMCISWNRKVQHILATASNQGLTVVWDLKNKKEVISFKDPSNRSRCSSLSWNPDVPTQLLVSYNDDTNPCVQLWDMRNCSYPFKEFQQHSRGVTAASYCDHDSNLIISSGRDNRTICWSINSDQMEPYSEVNLGSPATKIEWSPHLRGLLATSTSTGAVSVHSVLQRQTAVASRYAPKWVTIPCGVSFGFGGKVVMFGSKQTSKLQIHIVPDEPNVAQEADKFETFLSSDLRPFCNSMHESASDVHEKLTWKLLSIISDSPSDRRSIAAAFGVDVNEVKLAIDKYIGRDIQNSVAENVTQEINSPEKHVAGFSDPTSLDPDQLDNLFDQLAKNTESQQHQSQPVTTGSRRGTPRALLGEEIGDLTDWTQGPEFLIKQSILVGDFEGAVDCCMRCGRFADALLLAASGNPDLWKKTRDEYTRKQKDPFIRQIGFILAQDLEKLVYQSDLSEWPETLALLTTYAGNENYSRLVEQLAERLEKECFDVRSAVLCYIACGSFENTIRIWASMSHAQKSQCQALQGLVEKMSCLYAAIRPQIAGSIFSSKVTQYATLLANSGRTLAAMRFLMLIPDSVETRILKDRIFNAAPSIMSQLMQKPPPFPFEYVDIKAPHVAPQPIHPVSGAAQSQLQAQSQISNGRVQSQYQSQQNAYQNRPVPLQHASQPSFPTRTQLVTGAAIHQSGSGVHQSPVALPHNQQIPHSLQQPQTQALPQQQLAAPLTNTGLSAIGTNSAHLPVTHSSPIPSMRQPQLPPTIPTPQRPITTTTNHQQIPQRSVISTAIPGAPVSPQPGGLVSPQTTTHIPQSGHAAPVVGGVPHQQSHFQQRAVVGPPTSGGVSTAPHVTARSVTAGMPVPWPVPTAVQQQLTPNSVAPPAGAATATSQISEPMSSAEVNTIKQSLNSLLQRCAQDGNVRKWDDTGRKLNDLYDKLSNGHLTSDSKEKVKDLAACIDRGDFHHASRIRVELSASDWERNRTWLFALQLLLPK